MAEDVAAMNGACGTQITASYDLRTEVPDGSPGRTAGHGYQVCGEIARGIKFVCEEFAGGKQAVATKIKEVTCTFDLGSARRTPEWTPELALDGGVLRGTFDWNSSNVPHATSRWLRSKL